MSGPPPAAKDKLPGGGNPWANFAPPFGGGNPFGG